MNIHIQRVFGNDEEARKKNQHTTFISHEMILLIYSQARIFHRIFNEENYIPVCGLHESVIHSKRLIGRKDM